jgi:hypothetical protein
VNCCLLRNDWTGYHAVVLRRSHVRLTARRSVSKFSVVFSSIHANSRIRPRTLPSKFIVHLHTLIENKNMKLGKYHEKNSFYNWWWDRKCLDVFEPTSEKAYKCLVSWFTQQRTVWNLWINSIWDMDVCPSSSVSFCIHLAMVWSSIQGGFRTEWRIKDSLEAQFHRDIFSAHRNNKNNLENLYNRRYQGLNRAAESRRRQVLLSDRI